MRLPHAVLAVALVAAPSLAACSSGQDGGGASSTLVLGVATPPISLESGFGGNILFYEQAVYDTLLRKTPDAEIVPWVATTWSWDKSRTKLDLTLRDDVEFIDGTPLDADAVVANLLDLRAGLAPVAMNLLKVSGIEAIDATHVTIELSDPDPSLLRTLASVGMESPEVLQEESAKTDPVGSGPYVFDAAASVIGSRYVYLRNEDYWAPEVQHYDRLELIVHETSSSLLNAAKAGQIDGAAVPDPTTLDQFEAAGFDVYSVESQWSGIAFLDRDGTVDPAIGDKRVRQAIAYAIDKQAMLDAVLKGQGTITGQIFAPATEAYLPELDAAYKYDPDKSRDLLAQAGYEDGLTLTMPNIAAAPPVIFDLVQQYLAEVGITVDYEQLNATNLVPDLLAGKYTSTWLTLGGEATAWEVTRTTLQPSATFNPFRVDDPAINELVEEIQYGNEAEAAEAAQDLNRYVTDEALFAPWYRVYSNFVAEGGTQAEPQLDWNAPSLWTIRPRA